MQGRIPGPTTSEAQPIEPQLKSRTNGSAGVFVPALAVGWMIVALVFELPGAEGHPLGAQVREQFALDSDPAEWDERELRLLPGIGERRALAVRRSRREFQGTDFPGEAVPPAVPSILVWEEVPGIGERTAARVRAFLKDRGAPSLEVWSGSHGESGGG